MKKQIYQRLGKSALQVAALVGVLLVVKTFFPELVYAIVPIALALIVAFLAFVGPIKKLLFGCDS